MPNLTYFNTLFLCVWLQVINKVKLIKGEDHIKVKVKYLNPFKFYIAHTFCKWVVCIRLNAFLLNITSVVKKTGILDMAYMAQNAEMWTTGSLIRKTSFVS